VMKREIESLGHFDFSYVTSLKLCGWKYGRSSTGCNGTSTLERYTLLGFE
jgi:hypothetical protein